MLPVTLLMLAFRRGRAPGPAVGPRGRWPSASASSRSADADDAASGRTPRTGRRAARRVVFAVGLSLTVAPLTATVLASADVRHAGVASGVNNAVARAAGLLAVAGLPRLSASPGELPPAGELQQRVRHATTICAVILPIAAVRAWTHRNNVLRPGQPAVEPACRTNCTVGAPPLHPRRDASRPLSYPAQG